MHEIPKTQFVSLPDALCQLVASMQKLRQPTRLDNILDMLRRQYMGMSIPKKEIVHCTLEALTAEGRLCKTGDTYFMANIAPHGAWPGGSLGFGMVPHNPSGLLYPSCPSGLGPGGPYGPPHQLNQGHPFINPSPYNHPWWTNSLPRNTGSETERKPALCSTECQTGASIVNGVPPYQAKSCGQDASSSSREASSSTTTSMSRLQHSNDSTAKEKWSFIEKIFRRRSKSKPRDDTCSKENLKAPVRSTSADSKLSSAPTEPGKPDLVPPAVELLTFSAQFPPTEWIYRPTVGTNSRSNRLSMGPKDLRPVDDNDVFSRGIWIDMEPHHSSDLKHRRRGGDLWFASQRAPFTIPEESGSSGSREYSKRLRQRQRLSKYLSSSSECLKSVDIHGSTGMPTHSPKKRNTHSKKQHSSGSGGHYTRQLNALQQHPPPEASLPPPVKYPGEKVSKSFEVSPPRLMTSTPTPQISDSIEARKSDSTQNDSALSTSPVDSAGMDRLSGGSGQRRKYSSWSSVDENIAYPSPGSSDPMGGEAPTEIFDMQDHTYENIQDRNENTYENLGSTMESLSATKFEDITNLPPCEEDSENPTVGDHERKRIDVAPRISRTCVSAL